MEIYMFNKTFKKTSIGNYWISKDGEIINMNQKNPKILKQQTTWDGHKRIELYENGSSKKYYVHRLVYETYIGELIENFVIEHLDGNPSNNNYKNLKQSTQKENIDTALKQKRFGNNHSKKIIIKNIKTNEILEFDKIKDLAIFLDLSLTHYTYLKSIVKHNKFKNKYVIITDYKGQSTIESITVEKNNGEEASRVH